jgi:PleD family two-component response regulator
MVARADRALYQSKAAGRNRVTVAERAPSAAA